MTTLFFPNRGVDNQLIIQQLKQDRSEKYAPGHYHIFFSHDEPMLSVYQIGDKLVVVMGTPVINGEVATTGNQISELLEAATRQPDVIDSVFSIFVYSKDTRTLEIVTDRFGWFVIFWAEEASGTIFSTSLRDVVRLKQFQGSVDINDDAVFEFLWFRRLFGCHSFVKDVETLPYGSSLTFLQKDGNNCTTFWP